MIIRKAVALAAIVVLAACAEEDEIQNVEAAAADAAAALEAEAANIAAEAANATGTMVNELESQAAALENQLSNESGPDNAAAEAGTNSQ
jgi:hypothetical protein